MRMSQPWYRSQNDTWYVWHRGKQVPLAKGKNRKRKAQQAFFRLMAEDEPPFIPAKNPVAPPGSQLPVAVLLDQFLDWVHDNLKSYTWHRRFLELFAFEYGNLDVTQLKPLHVTNWLAGRKWGPTTRNKVIGTLNRAFNWAVDQGLIEDNPILRLKKPRAKRRDRILSGAEREEILAAIRDQPFRNFVTALQETGARPGEIAQVTSQQVNLKAGVWVLQEHKTAKQTQRPRVIYLTPKMIELSCKLCDKFPEGPIFRNRRGRPWTRNAVRIRFKRLRERLPQLKGVVAYSYRHTFATDGLERGVPIATMAELLGHQSTAMLASHYGHLSEKREHLLRAVSQATAAGS